MGDNKELSPQAEYSRACSEKEGQPSIVRASEIQQLHSEIMGALRQTVEKAIRIGELLTEQKSDCQHGEWLPWLEGNVGFSPKTADNYRHLYEQQDKIVNVTNLTEAYRAIGLLGDGGKETSEEETDTEPEPLQTEQEVISEPDETEEQEPDVIDAKYTELETESEVVEEPENNVNEDDVNQDDQMSLKDARVPGQEYEGESAAVTRFLEECTPELERLEAIDEKLGLCARMCSRLQPFADRLNSIMGATNE